MELKESTKSIEQLEKEYRIDITIATKDRVTALYGLLQALRTQTFQSWDLFLWDDASSIGIFQEHHISSIINRIKLEGHRVHLFRNQISQGISFMRQQMAEWICKDSNNNLIARIDDDTLPEPDYLELLVKTIDSGYDLASGITPPLMQPELEREIRFIKPFISELKVDKEGNILSIGDECGFAYLESEILPSQHFRSSAVYKKEIHTKHDIWYEQNLTPCGFREEEFFSLKIINKGLKIGIHTKAKHYHVLTPSGGDRRGDYSQLALQNELLLREFYKKMFEKYGDFIGEYNKQCLMNI